jgi:hypothetical protein
MEYGTYCNFILYTVRETSLDYQISKYLTARACMGKKKNAYTILVGKTEENR